MTDTLTDTLCSDCPPVGYPTDETRCAPCPRRTSDDAPCTGCGGTGLNYQTERRCACQPPEPSSDAPMDFYICFERLVEWAMAYAAECEEDGIPGVIAQVNRDQLFMRREIEYTSAMSDLADSGGLFGAYPPRPDLALGALQVAIKTDQLDVATCFAQTAQDFLTGNYDPDNFDLTENERRDAAYPPAESGADDGAAWGRHTGQNETNPISPPLSAIAEAERALAEWMPELEAARIKLCQHMVERADAYGGSVGRLLLEGEMAFTLLGDIIARASAALRAIPAMTGAADPRNREEPNGWRPTHRHVKRGTEYEYLGWGRAQCSESGLLDDEHVAIYRGEDGSLWARRLAEFNDGRFEHLPPPPSQESEG